jgi:hypothetical protein
MMPTPIALATMMAFVGELSVTWNAFSRTNEATYAPIAKTNSFSMRRFGSRSYRSRV